MYKKLLNEVPYLILGALIIYFFYTHSPNFDYDSFTYINFDSTRPFIYPLFIYLFRWAGPYQFVFIVWVQGILLFLALLFARHWLKKNFQISDFALFLVCLFVILTISFHFQIGFILSEGLSFPLFIFTFFTLIECFHQFNLKKICYLALLSSALILTRLQFYYLYIIFVLLCFWYFYQGLSYKKIVQSIIILFGSMLLTLFIDYSYHYFKHNHFGGAPYGAMLIMVQTLYLADNNAADYFKDPVIKAYMQIMLNQMNIKHWNKDAASTIILKPTNYDLAYQTYRRNYQPITKMIDKILREDIRNPSRKISKINANNMAIEINKTLFLHTKKQNLFFFFWKFIQNVGGIPVFLFFLILQISILYKIFHKKMRDINLSIIFISTIIIITFLNAAMIATCNPDLPVYFCYSHFMLYCLAAFLANRACADARSTAGEGNIF